MNGYLCARSYKMVMRVCSAQVVSERGGVHASALEPSIKFSLLAVSKETESRRTSDVRTSAALVGGPGDGIRQGEGTVVAGAEKESATLKNTAGRPTWYERR